MVQPLAAITLMQSFPLHVVNDDRSRLAFANGQYILIERTAYEAAGGHRAVRERFVEDIGMAEKVKSLGLPIRVALVRGLVLCRMYSSFRQLVRGWSRILYDALGRKTWRLVLKLLDPIIFCQSGHLALAAALVLMALGRSGPSATWLLVLAVDPSCVDVLAFSARLHILCAGHAILPLVPAWKPGRGLDPGPRHLNVPDRQRNLAGNVI